MPRSIALLVAVALAALAGGCSTNPATGGSTFTAFMSSDEELKVGREEHPKIVAQFGGEIGEARIRDYVARLGRSLAARSEMPELDWHFTVLNSDIVNAFALPGGYVYVTRGLVALASSEAELAGVLGHEIGHVTARHSAQRYSSGVVAQVGTVAATVLGGILLGSSGAQLGQAAAGGVGQVALASYSREQEFEADQLGVRYLGRADYEPLALARFLEKLQGESGLQAELSGRPGSGDQFSLLQSHPRTPDRVRQAIEQAGEAARPANPRLQREEFLRVVDGMSWGGDAENGFVKNSVFVHPKLRFRFEVPEGFRLLNSATAVAAAGPDGARIIFDRDPRAPRGQLAAYLRRAGAESIEELSLDGSPATTGTGQARSSGGQGYTMRIALIASPDEVWRFRFLAPPPAWARYADSFRRTLLSFDRMSAQEAAAQRPLRLRVVPVRPGDTQDSMAARMATRDLALRRFQVINGLQPGDTLQPGQPVKIVTE